MLTSTSCSKCTRGVLKCKAERPSWHKVDVN